MAVFVLDRRQQPLMPCTEKRARLLLERGRARMHRLYPFTIRLLDREVEANELQPIRLKLDPGSRTTGIALVRENKEGEGEGESKGQVLHLAELSHRANIREKLQQRSSYRRGRRSRNTRYRAPRFLNRTKPKGWLAPSLRVRVEGVSSWVERYQELVPLSALSVETVRFDTQALLNPEISGVEYQQGELQGYEVKEYLLEKWGRRCVYCQKTKLPLEVEHIVPKSRGGTDRVSNLTLSCRPCNQEKGARTAEEFGHPEVQQRARQPLRDAAAVNSTRWALYRSLASMGLPVEVASGGMTKFNRKRLGLPKTHALDAVAVGASTPEVVQGCWCPVLGVATKGRGRYQRTLPDKQGFPRGYLMRQKTVQGFQTGDRVRAEVPRGKYAGTYPSAEVRVRASGFFDLFGPAGKLAQGVRYKHCTLLCRFDGYTYNQRSGASSPALKARVFAPKN